jgi:hypothetical protein
MMARKQNASSILEMEITSYLDKVKGDAGKGSPS